MIKFAKKIGSHIPCIFSCLILLNSAGCSSISYAGDKEDSWYASPSKECSRIDREQGRHRTRDERREMLLDKGRRLREVPKSMADIAIKDHLLDKPFAKIVAGEMMYYLMEDYGVDYRTPENTEFYLVRALYSDGIPGGFYFTWCGEDLWVERWHDIWGDPETKRTALILNLKKAPRNVYITL